MFFLERKEKKRKEYIYIHTHTFVNKLPTLRVQLVTFDDALHEIIRSYKIHHKFTRVLVEIVYIYMYTHTFVNKLPT